MSDPSQFVSFADYLGLNQDAGQSMTDRAVGDYHDGKSLDDITKLSDQNLAYANNTQKDGGVYGSTKEAVRTGLTSYGDFLKRMSTPEGRQSLMEDTYGKGHVSALDAAISGNSGGLDAANDKFKQTSSYAAQTGNRADIRRADQTQQDARYAENAAFEKKQAQQRYDTQQAATNAQTLARKNAIAGLGEGSAFDKNGIRYDENGGRHDVMWDTQRAAKNMGFKNPDGTYNWASYNRKVKELGDKSKAEADSHQGLFGEVHF